MRDKSKRTYRGYPIVSTLLLAFTILLLGSPAVVLVIFAEKLKGALFVVLWIVYLAALLALMIPILRAAKLRRLRSTFGDELFFAYYPKEYRRELRRWRRTEAYRAGAALSGEAEDVPALLKLGRALSDEDAARLGIVRKDRRDALFGADDAANETRGETYDLLYYRAHPRMLRWDLFRTRTARLCANRLLRRDRAPSPLEQRLSELKDRFESE